MATRKKRQRPEIKIVAHFMHIDGKEVAIDPYKTDLPDRCKMALMEMTYGHQYKLIDASGS